MDVITTCRYLPDLKKKKIYECTSTHQGCTGDGSAERGNNDNRQPQRVLENRERQENVPDTQPHGQGCGAPDPEAMASQAGEGERPPRKAAGSSGLAPELQIVDGGERGVPWGEGCRPQVLSHHRQAVWLRLPVLGLFLGTDFVPGYEAEPELITTEPFLGL